MGTHDGAEICELVELHLLNRRSTVTDKSVVVLYRDDELDAIINNANSPKFDRNRKDVTALLKEEGLSITIERYLIEIDILDVNFNLATEKYFPFRKANNTPLYMNALLITHLQSLDSKFPKSNLYKLVYFTNPV